VTMPKNKGRLILHKCGRQFRQKLRVQEKEGKIEEEERMKTRTTKENLFSKMMAKVF